MNKLASKVLVCALDPDIRRLLTEILSRMGLEVTSTGDGVQARDLLRSLRPDLVISEVDLPGLSGSQLIEALREETGSAEVPCVLMVPYYSDADTLQAELVYCLTKPFTVGEVQQVVRKALPSLGAS